MLARLDAEGTDAFRLDLDRIPAINGAQKLLASVANSYMDSKKGVGELLRDLNKTIVAQTSTFGKVDIDNIVGIAGVNHRLWTILAVYPEFVSTNSQAVLTDSVPERSLPRLDVRFAYPTKSAKRLTQEQWDKTSVDPFSPGNSVLVNSLVEYGYTFATRQVSDGVATGPELAVFPHVAGTRRVLAVSYLKEPSELPILADVTDPQYNTLQVEWPPTAAELIISLALRIITYKQGDGTTVNSLTAQETQMLVQAMA